MVSAVLFDLDGVLVDSEEFSSQASDAVLAKVGIVQTPEEKKNVFGRRTHENYQAAIDARGLDIDANELVMRKNRLFAEIIKGRIKPLEGVVELIKHLRESGIRIAVVSSSPLDRVNATLTEVNLLLEFELIISGDCCVMGKPDPEPFLLAAERFYVKPEECIVVEDAQAGVASGKAAGMKVLAVKSPNTHGQDLSKADKIVDSLRGVDIDFLKKI